MMMMIMMMMHNHNDNNNDIFMNNDFNSDDNIDGIMQEGRKSIANAAELRLSCINPSILSSFTCWFLVTESSLLQVTACRCPPPVARLNIKTVFPGMGLPC